MTEKSNWWETEMLNLMFLTYDPVYVALFTTNPDEDASGTEVSGGSYARESVAASVFVVLTGSAANNTNIEFTEATANWGTVSHAAIFTSASGGDMLYYSPLDSSVVINTGQVFRVNSGSLVISED